MDIAGGAWIFLAVIIVFTVAVIYGLYTKKGSGIEQRPYGKIYGGAPGAKETSVLDHDRSAADRFATGREKPPRRETTYRQHTRGTK